jgi:hypothetical protein
MVESKIGLISVYRSVRKSMKPLTVLADCRSNITFCKPASKSSETAGKLDCLARHGLLTVQLFTRRAVSCGMRICIIRWTFVP